MANIRSEFVVEFTPEFVADSMARRAGDDGTIIDSVHQRSAARTGASGSGRAQ